MITTKLSRSIFVLFIWTALAGFAAAQEPATPKLPLSAAQLTAFKKIHTDAEAKAAPLVIELAKTVKEVYANMLANKEDQQLRVKLNKRLHLTAGRLLDIKGQSLREMLALLTPGQKALLQNEMKKPGAPLDIGELIDHVFNISVK